MSAQRGRIVAGGDAVLFEGGDGCLLGFGVLRESEVVSGGVVDSVVIVFVVVLGQDVGGGSGEHDSIVK